LENVDIDIESFIPSDLKERYIDFQYVGQGGMGRIISAVDTKLDKRVAIKILPSMIVSDTAVVRFHQEAKAVSKLNHQHIVQVLDFGFASSGEPYLVMEYVKGETLDSLLDKNKTLPLRTIISLAIQMCLGLQHAHANKIVHRDLKPANIMIDESNVVRVLDFGLAKLLEDAHEDSRLTKPGQAMGSPLYMSPEQLRAEEVDERSDIYSLGLVIYKMVTGTVPFEGENLMRVLMGRMQEAPPALPPSETEPLLNEALSRIIEQALEVDRDARIASMTELKESLEELESIVDIKEEEPEEHNWFEAKIFTRKNAKILASIVGIALLFAAPTLIPAILHRFETVRTVRDKDGEVRGNEHTVVVPEAHPLPSGFVFDKQSGYWDAQTRLEDNDLKRLKGTGVERVDLQSNKNITVEGIKTLSTLRLKGLTLRDTHLGDEIAPYINKMTFLEALDLRLTKFTDNGIKQLNNSNHLRFLDLGYLSGITNTSMPLIAKKFPNLRNLHLSTTSVDAKGLEQLKPLQLYGLILTALKLTDDDMDVIVMLKPKRITLESNPITDAGLDKLKAIPGLQHISIEYCEKITKKKLDEFKQKKISIRDPFPETQEVNDAMTLFAEPADIDEKN